MIFKKKLLDVPAPLLNDTAEANPVLKESPVESADGLPNRRLEPLEVLGLHGVDHRLQVAPEEEVAWGEVRRAGRPSKRPFFVYSIAGVIIVGSK